MIRAKPLDLLGVRYVVEHMRRSDWVEISNLVPRQLATVDALTILVVQHSTLGFLVEVDGVPAAVVQTIQKHDGCWAIGMFATDEFPRAWRTIIRHGYNVLAPAMMDVGARYCEAHVHADNVAAQGFLKSMGFRARSDVLEHYGAFGEPFILYAATRKEFRNVHRQIPEGSGSQSAG